MNFLFLSGNGYLNSVWDYNTIYLYFIIVIVAYIFANISYRKRLVSIDNEYKYRINVINKFAFTLVFLFLAFFSIFRDVGTDLPTYRNIFNNANLGSAYFNSQEPGYMIINIIFNKLGFSDFGFITLISFLTLFLVFKTIYDNAYHINIGLSILAFVSLYYLQSFSLIRIYLVAAFILYSSKYLFNRQYRKYLFCILISVLFHYSAILMLLPFFLFYVYERKRSLFIPILMASCFVGFIAVGMLSRISVFTRYASYLSEGPLRSGFGYIQFAYSIPNLCLWLYARKKGFSGPYMNVLLVYSLAALLIGTLSYKVMMLGRSLVYYNILYVICIPYILYKIKTDNYKTGLFFNSLYVIYLFFRLVIYMDEYLISDGLMPYKFIQ